MSGAVAEDLFDPVGEAAGGAEALLVGRRVGEVGVGPHHVAEFGAVDVVDGAELLDQLALLVAGDDAYRVRARRFAELHGEDAEAAGRAPDQDVVARLQLALVHQHPVGGEVGEPVGAGLGPAHVLGAGEELLGLHFGELGEGAPGGLVAPDPLARRGERVEPVHLDVLVGGLVAVDDDLVADLPAGDALADLPDDSGGVGAADVVAELGVVAVGEDRDRFAQRGPDVVEVHPGRHHADDDLEGAGLRDLDLLELEGVFRLALALLPDHPGSHRLRERPRLDVEVGQVAGIDSQGFLRGSFRDGRES